MNSFDLVKMGLKNLFRRKMRTFLTVLGVIIGTASIVIMVSLGFGMKYSYQNQIEKMGSITVINVYPNYGDMGGMKGEAVSTKTGTLDDNTISQFSKINGVQAVTPVIDSYVRIVSGKYSADVSIRGIIPETMQYFDMEASEGRLLNKDDEENLVFGSTIPLNFMDARARSRMMYGMNPGQNQKPLVNVLKDKMYITFDFSYGDKKSPMQSDQPQIPAKLFKAKGVGLLKESQKDSDYAVYADIKYLKKIIQDNASYQSKQQGQKNVDVSQQLKYQRAMVKVKSIGDVESVQKAIKDMGFQASSLNDILDSMKKTSSTIQLILGGIGAVSLLVAALGITNTMIMSIYERTREIGIMKVIGASLRDIKKLFLFESGMIGIIGGIIGLILSKAASLILNVVGKNYSGIFGTGGEGSKISIIPLWLVFSVLVFTFFVGLFSGYYPAKRAMKLSALEAIKTE